ncbi:hypothetical protein [Epilithonimonas zeae]|uniref:hypothetical protein n=1 Tax=Epilithonimonas zeae TaxID=1416779 RepID=UPI0020101D7E|nr:hypothetical protein [Epilithonimonas zeae]UQB69977.1 hypothetical protein KI430_06000 [Epilithonimonas zeae]
MNQVLPLITIFLVCLIFIFWKSKSHKKQATSSLTELDIFMSLQFSLDHAEFTLNKNKNLYPFAMTMSNNGVDTDYYNFENKEVSIENIENQLKESKTDMGLILIISNDAENSRLEIQSFLKGIKKSKREIMNYKTVDNKYIIDRQNIKTIDERPNFIY